MYLMVLEVVLLGFVVLIIAPILFVRYFFLRLLRRNTHNELRYSGMSS
jgi:hypothetical protein